MFGNERLVASLRTDQGRVRDHNEDYVASVEPASESDEAQDGWLYIVADGVGGAEAGEIASEFATERTIYHYLNNRQEPDFNQRLIKAMQLANDDLQELIVERATGKRMATTMVAAVIHSGVAVLGNVGDSRGYHWQDGMLRQVTKDQSLVAKLVEEGVITEEEAINHPRKNVILQSLGSEDPPQIDLFEVALAPSEQLVMCSDGLTRHVSDQEINEVISEHDPPEATEKLIQLANDRGGEDNITVAVLQIGDVSNSLSTELSPRTAVTPNGKIVSNGESERGAFWFQTATLALMYLFLVLLIWILTGR
jgi:protein phosphatase